MYSQILFETIGWGKDYRGEELTGVFSEIRRKTNMKFVLGIVMVTVAFGGEAWKTPEPAAGLPALRRHFQ